MTRHGVADMSMPGHPPSPGRVQTGPVHGTGLESAQAVMHLATVTCVAYAAHNALAAVALSSSTSCVTAKQSSGSCDHSRERWRAVQPTRWAHVMCAAAAVAERSTAEEAASRGTWRAPHTRAALRLEQPSLFRFSAAGCGSDRRGTQAKQPPSKAHARRLTFEVGVWYDNSGVPIGGLGRTWGRGWRGRRPLSTPP